MVSATTRPRVSDVIVRVATPALTAVKVSISYHTRMVIALGYKTISSMFYTGIFKVAHIENNPNNLSCRVT